MDSQDVNKALDKLCIPILDRPRFTHALRNARYHDRDMYERATCLATIIRATVIWPYGNRSQHDIDVRSRRTPDMNPWPLWKRKAWLKADNLSRTQKTERIAAEILRSRRRTKSRKLLELAHDACHPMPNGVSNDPDKTLWVRALPTDRTEEPSLYNARRGSKVSRAASLVYDKLSPLFVRHDSAQGDAIAPTRQEPNISPYDLQRALQRVANAPAPISAESHVSVRSPKPQPRIWQESWRMLQSLASRRRSPAAVSPTAKDRQRQDSQASDDLRERQNVTGLGISSATPTESASLDSFSVVGPQSQPGVRQCAEPPRNLGRTCSVRASPLDIAQVTLPTGAYRNRTWTLPCGTSEYLEVDTGTPLSGDQVRIGTKPVKIHTVSHLSSHGGVVNRYTDGQLTMQTVMDTLREWDLMRSNESDPHATQHAQSVAALGSRSVSPTGQFYTDNTGHVMQAMHTDQSTTAIPLDTVGRLRVLRSTSARWTQQGA